MGGRACGISAAFFFFCLAKFKAVICCRILLGLCLSTLLSSPGGVDSLSSLEVVVGGSGSASSVPDLLLIVDIFDFLGPTLLLLSLLSLLAGDEEVVVVECSFSRDRPEEVHWIK